MQREDVIHEDTLVEDESLVVRFRSRMVAGMIAGLTPKRAHKLMEEFDKDGDGKLSEAERSEARKALGSRSGRSNPQAGQDQQKQRRARYDAVAKNLREQVKAGKITEEQARERLGQLRKRMAQANSDNNKSERSRGSREKLMKEFDKNKDGKLDEKERAALRKEMSSSGRRGGEGAERSSRGRRGGERSEGGDRRRRSKK